MVALGNRFQPIIFKLSLDNGKEGRATVLESILFLQSVILLEETPWLPKVRLEQTVPSYSHSSFFPCENSIHSVSVTSLECTKILTKGIHSFQSQFLH